MDDGTSLSSLSYIEGPLFFPFSLLGMTFIRDKVKLHTGHNKDCENPVKGRGAKTVKAIAKYYGWSFLLIVRSIR